MSLFQSHALLRCIQHQVYLEDFLPRFELPLPCTQNFHLTRHLLTKQRRAKSRKCQKSKSGMKSRKQRIPSNTLPPGLCSFSAWLAALDQLWVFSVFQRLEIIQEIGFSTSVFLLSLSFSTYVGFLIFVWKNTGDK